MAHGVAITKSRTPRWLNGKTQCSLKSERKSSRKRVNAICICNLSLPTLYNPYTDTRKTHTIKVKGQRIVCKVVGLIIIGPSYPVLSRSRESPRDKPRVHTITSFLLSIRDVLVHLILMD